MSFSFTDTTFQVKQLMIGDVLDGGSSKCCEVRKIEIEDLVISRNLMFWPLVTPR